MIVANETTDGNTPERQLRWHEVMSLVSLALTGDDAQLAMQAGDWLRDIGNLLERQRVPLPCPEVIELLTAQALPETQREPSNPEDDFPSLYRDLVEQAEMQAIADEHFRCNGGDC